ncbi:uncharacterized protein LOC106142219 [Amyelois transitella]|uniref:uncharacterized protein LOC106142219 n=1 Tax=Amyelois transitella TaxID=680683 RepID=UPI00298F68A6|nr:uncharacterized protein LOC106142219 [Amyelois transitella]
MGCARNIFALIALLVVIGEICGQISQGGPHQSQGGAHGLQGRSRRQVVQDGEENVEPLIVAACDNNTIPSISCYDCTTRLICKPNSIVLVKCRGNVRPYCNNGICSSVLTPECE